MHDSEPIRLSGHHLNMIIWNYRFMFMSTEREMKEGERYDRSSIYNIIHFLRDLVKKPNSKVQLIIGPDSICEYCNNLENSKCKNPYDYELDKKMIEEQKFKPNQIVTVRQILENTIKPYYF